MPRCPNIGVNPIQANCRFAAAKWSRNGWCTIVGQAAG
jgi:hypothetical protein